MSILSTGIDIGRKVGLEEGRLEGIHSIIIVKASKSSIGSLFSNSFSILTVKELLAKSITTGLSSSDNGLSSSKAYIALPNCCKYKILEF